MARLYSSLLHRRRRQQSSSLFTYLVLIALLAKPCLCLLQSSATAAANKVSQPSSAGAQIKTSPVTPKDLRDSQSTDKIFAKFKNLSRKRLEIVDGETKKTIGVLASGDTSSMALLQGQAIVTRIAGSDDEQDEVIDTFSLTGTQSFYGIGQGLGRTLSPFQADHLDADLVEEYVEEAAFIKRHTARTGMPWLSQYGFYKPHLGPRTAPTIAKSLWPAERLGQSHTTRSSEGYWLNQNTQQKGKDLQLSLQVISTRPRVFAIQDFLSDFEADELIRLGRVSGRMHESVVGSEAMGGNVRDSQQRSSSNAWLSPPDSPIVNSVYLRAADLLQVPRPAMLQATEAMQLVYYNIGQHYQSHFDWEVRGKQPASRFATLLLYLNDQASETAGGETAFPSAVMPNGARGFKVHPGKRNAILFYNLLEDGNGDNLSLHGALPVVEGEKWAANLWVWG